MIRPLSLLCSVFTALLLLPSLLSAQALEKKVAEQLPNSLKLYRDLHRNPELSFQEEETAVRMAELLKKAGFEVSAGIGGYGVVGVYKNGDGPTVLVRCDTDGLPVKEETGLPYASEAKGKNLQGLDVNVMHACGHDVHMTVWAETAKMLHELRDQWQGTLVFIAQPAEEVSGGAKAMLAGGLYEKFPKPDYALALHVSPSLKAGTVGICPEYAMANVDMVNITVYGQGGHGAYPHTTIDPVVISSKLVLELQTIVSREISPLQPAVLTVGSIHGGTKGNVIPEFVELELTLRSYDDGVREHLIEGIRRTAKGLAIANQLPEKLHPVISIQDQSTPSLYNDPALSERFRGIASSAIGAENVLEVKPSMAGEDFGRYGRQEHKVPILLYWLGTVSSEKYEKAQTGEMKLPPLHNAYFAPDPEPTLQTGIKTLTAAILDLCKK